jgi:hypothetical protein
LGGAAAGVFFGCFDSKELGCFFFGFLTSSSRIIERWSAGKSSYDESESSYESSEWTPSESESPERDFRGATFCADFDEDAFLVEERANGLDF